MRSVAAVLVVSALAACASEPGREDALDAAADADAGAHSSDPDADTSADASTGPLQVRIMTFNLRWDGLDDGPNDWIYRKDLAAEVLRTFGAHSVGTQEPMAEQIADLEAALPTLGSFQYGDNTQQIVYDEARVTRIEADGFLVKEDEGGNGTIRFCTWVHMLDGATGRRYYHYNVHLDHRSAPSREISVVRLMRHIASRAHPEDPFVVTGDFNTGEQSPTMLFLRGLQTLPDESGLDYANPIPLVDTFRVLYPDATGVGTGHGFTGTEDGAMIDHVLVEADAATVLEAEIVHTHVDALYPSDHFPVTAVFEWP